MTGELTLYYNTGFNGVDIPAYSTVLDAATWERYQQVYFTRMDYDKPYIDISAPYESVRDVDYVKFSTTTGGQYPDLRVLYFFCVPEALAKGVTRLHLSMDYLLSMGGAASLTYSSGWQERGHIAKADDALFGNHASEDWLPLQPLHVAHAEKIGNRTGSDLWADVDVVISAIDLGKLGDTGALTTEVIEGIVSGESEASMYFPATPLVSSGTTYKAWDFTDNSYKTFTIPSSGAFQILAHDDRVWRGLEKLYACGQLQLQASYKIPGEYLDPDGGANPVQTTGNQGKISEIRGVHKTITLATMPFEYTVDNGQYQVKNKKCFGTYRQFVIVALGTSDTSIQEAELLYDGSALAPSIWVWSDPTSNGKPYARFTHIKGNPILYADTVKGLPWQTNQIAMEGASGSVWNALNAGYANAVQARAQQAQNNSMYFGTRGRELLAGNLAENYRYSQAGSAMGAIANALGGASALGNNYVQSLNRYGAGKNKSMIPGRVSAASGMLSAAGEIAASTAQSVIGMQSAQAQLSQQLNMLQLQQREANAGQELEMAKIAQAINENKIGLIRNNMIVSPTLLFTPEQNLGMYGYNYFMVYELRKSDEDLKSEDAYYQRFGYNGIHRPLTAQCFNERTYYSYVQAYDVNIKTAYPLRMRMGAIAQLNQGVRVWKTLPNAQLYEVN